MLCLILTLFLAIPSFAGNAKPSQPVAAQDFVAESLTTAQAELLNKWSTQKKVDTIISGTINLHSGINVPAGGELHLRLVNISSIYRPFLFKRFYKVQFPFKYEIKTSDFVGNIGLHGLLEPYYIEAFYYRYLPNKTPGFDDPTQVVGGEAWGNPGRPYPLTFGQPRDFKLNFWWTPEIFGSRFSTPIKNSPLVMSGWLYPSALLKKKFNNAKLIEGTINVCDKNLQLVKSVPFKITDLNRPLEWHAEMPAHIKGFISVIGMTKKESGEIVYLYGTRANARVAVSLPVSNLKVALTTASNSKWSPCLPENYHGH